MPSSGSARRTTLLLAGAYLAFALYWVLCRQGDFFFLRGDDIGRVVEAFRNRGSYAWAWDGGWLPLPRWLLSTALLAAPYPYKTPLLLHAAEGAACLLLVGLLAARLFPKSPEAAGVAVCLAALD